MKSSFALAAGMVAVAAAQGTLAPAGCQPSYNGAFQITAINTTTAATKRDLQKRACSADQFTVTLADGQFKDNRGRLGYIASNRQFQFDQPVQAGAISTGGWSVCSNGSVALGSSALFYECLSGDFYNLYDQTQGAQCSPINIGIIPCDASSPGVISQISDGQPQASTAAPHPISQISDGQPQVAPTPLAPITQISDGQVQAPTGKPTGKPISQISDGQVQAPTGTPAISKPYQPISQISDGQVQASTGTVKPTGTGAYPTSSIVPFPGAGNMVTVGASSIVAAVALALAALI